MPRGFKGAMNSMTLKCLERLIEEVKLELNLERCVDWKMEFHFLLTAK
jgi:hypothetical protein